MKIIYQTNSFIVCEKPAGILSQEGPGRTMPALLREALGGEIYTVHRLDTAASGCMVYARTKQAAAALSKQIADGVFTKEYLAAVHGKPDAEAGEYEDLLFKDSAKNKTYVVDKPRRGVKQARLAYRVLQSAETPCGYGSLVCIKLYTGRTHQIRVQFASRGSPLFGDGKYGAKDNLPRLALFSCRLTFADPDTGEPLEFTLPVPEEAPWGWFSD
jgi:23S rRNA pseudouridine1911/1915/1917 synthase